MSKLTFAKEFVEKIVETNFIPQRTCIQKRRNTQAKKYCIQKCSKKCEQKENKSQRQNINTQ